MKKKWVLWLAAALLVCLLPGMTREASAETGEVGEIIKRTCRACKKYTQVQIVRHYAKGEGFQVSDVYHWTDFKCLSCGQTFMMTDDIVGKHIGGDETPTCTTGKTCSLCGGDYGKLGHDWGEWTANGNGTHSHACKRDGCDATETKNCSGDGSASCVTKGTCTTCGGAYSGGHYFERPYTYGYDENVHWHRCKYCDEGREAEGAHFYVESREDQYLASKATCVSKAIYYKSCTICRCTGMETFEDPWGETDQKNHDLKHFTAKAPTCTEKGWKEYDECQREGCKYTTKKVLPATDHTFEYHAGQPATCTEVGWEAYETCKNCAYTTFKLIPASGHNYVEQIIEPTCTKDGCTLHTCTNCNDSYTTNPTKKLYHWFAEWSPNEDDTHGAHCRRKGCKYVAKVDCQKFEFPVDEESLIFCPVCGEVQNGERLERIAKATAKIVTGKRPKGELIVRTDGTFLSVAYEYAGKISEAAAQITITLPADALNGMKPVLVSLDGTETALPFETAGDKITFTLDFAEPEMPVFLIRLVSET